MQALGAETWFQSGDRGLARQLARTVLLRGGVTLTEATLELCRRFGLRSSVLPMCDQPVRTLCITDAGSLSLQEYFVREQLKPGLVAVELEGADAAHPAEIAVEALSAADLIVIGPSNPFVSIDPIVRVLG